MKKGSKHSPEMRVKLKEMLLSYHKTDKFKANHQAALSKMKGKNHPGYGKKRSEESRKKMSESQKKNPVSYWLGKNNPHMAGENNCNWNGGVSYSRNKIRTSIEYREWRRRVFYRDMFTCRVCLAHSGNGKALILNAHHIEPFRTGNQQCDVKNGITVCEECHKIMHYREHLFINLLKGILENEFNSVETSKEVTPSQQERLREALWACVTVRGE